MKTPVAIIANDFSKGAGADYDLSLQWAEIIERNLNVQGYVIAPKRTEAAAELESANARIEELVEALELILPLAKGYAHAHKVGSNAKYVRFAEEVVANATPDTAEPMTVGDDVKGRAEHYALGREDGRDEMRERVAKLAFESAGPFHLGGDEDIGNAFEALAEVIRSLPLDPDSATGDEK